MMSRDCWASDRGRTGLAAVLPHRGPQIRLGARAACTVALLCLAIACSADGGGGPTGISAPVPGDLSVRMDEAATPMGAVLLRLRGPDMSDFEAGSSPWILRVMETGRDTVRVAVLMNSALSSGTILSFRVPDVNAADRYAVDLLEVAGEDNRLVPLSGYGVSVGE